MISKQEIASEEKQEKVVVGFIHVKQEIQEEEATVVLDFINVATADQKFQSFFPKSECNQKVKSSLTQQQSFYTSSFLAQKHGEVKVKAKLLSKSQEFVYAGKMMDSVLILQIEPKVQLRQNMVLHQTHHDDIKQIVSGDPVAKTRLTMPVMGKNPLGNSRFVYVKKQEWVEKNERNVKGKVDSGTNVNPHGKRSYSRNKMESLRFLNVEQQHNVWHEVYLRMGSAVAGEYEDLAKAKPQELCQKNFDHSQRFGMRKENGPVLSMPKNKQDGPILYVPKNKQDGPILGMSFIPTELMGPAVIRECEGLATTKPQELCRKNSDHRQGFRKRKENGPVLGVPKRKQDGAILGRLATNGIRNPLQIFVQ